MPPPEGTPEYERNFEKIFTWLEGKYPPPTEDGEGWGSMGKGALLGAITGHGVLDGALAGSLYDTIKGKKPKKKKEEDAESREERADVDKYEYEQGKEAGEREDHAKGVKMALEALEMFKDELHVDGHPEDINVNELADAHDQLSRALHWLLDEIDVEQILGGRATQRSEAQSQPEQFDGLEMEWDNI